MKHLLQDEAFLAAVVLALAVAGLLNDVIGGFIRRARENRRKAAATVRFADLRARLWAQRSLCPDVDAETGALIARAERATRSAFTMEEQARTRLACLEAGADRDRSFTTVADSAIAAEQRMQRLLSELERTLSGADAEVLTEAHAAWLLYRDHHVRLCRENRLGSDDRWPVRHYVSEAVTLARIADLEDLQSVQRIGR